MALAFPISVTLHLLGVGQMKKFHASCLFVSMLLSLQACSSRPDAASVKKSTAVSTQQASQSTTNGTVSGQNSSNANTNVDVAQLQAKQAALETEKAELLAQKSSLANQGSAFSQYNASTVPTAMFGDFMADAEALPVAVDQAKIDAIVQAAMDMDFDALQKAIEDLLADIEALAADLQAQIDDLEAQIAAAS